MIFFVCVLNTTMKKIIKISFCVLLAAFASCGSGDTGEGVVDTIDVSTGSMPEDSVVSALGDGDTTQQMGNRPDNTSNGADTARNPLRQ